jgi:hypothetical protein
LKLGFLLLPELLFFVPPDFSLSSLTFFAFPLLSPVPFPYRRPDQSHDKVIEAILKFLFFPSDQTSRISPPTYSFMVNVNWPEGT